jgi:anhydro-N-acetylmuramic acid kinase
MSGTSIDGVDGVIGDFGIPPCRTLAHVHVGFEAALRSELTALQRKGADELRRSALAANGLMDACAAAVSALLTAASLEPSQIAAIGVHGQTIRHRPDQGLRHNSRPRAVGGATEHNGGRGFPQSRRRRRWPRRAAGPAFHAAHSAWRTGIAWS